MNTNAGVGVRAIVRAMVRAMVMSMVMAIDRAIVRTVPFQLCMPLSAFVGMC